MFIRRQIFGIFFWVSFISILLFFSDSSAKGAEPENDQSPVKQLQEENLAFPSSVAKIREVYDSKKSESVNMVFHIQDAHCNPGAQYNIRKIVEELVTRYEVRFIGIEGAIGDIDFEIFRKGTKENRENVCKSFIEKGVLTGTEALGICGDTPFYLYGLENKQIYLRNFISLLDTISTKQKNERYINELNKALDILKPKMFTTRELKSFDLKYQSFLDEEIKRSEYLLFLNDFIEKNQNLHDLFSSDVFFPNLKKAFTVAVIEKNIDFEQVKKERALISEKIRLLPDEEKLLFDSKEKSFNLSQLSQISFYSYLLSLSEKYMPDKPRDNIKKHMEVLRTLKEIRSEKLLGEIREFSHEIELKLCQSQDERTLVEFIRSARILGRLLDLRLTGEQLRYYKLKKENFSLNKIICWTRQKSDEYDCPFPKMLETEPVSVNYCIQSAENYYHGLIKRDFILGESFLEEMKRNGYEKGIIITGGFHTEGLTDYFRELDIAYTVISPSVGKPTDLYFNVMSASKNMIENEMGPPYFGLAPPLITDISSGLTPGHVLESFLKNIDSGSLTDSRKTSLNVNDLSEEQKNTLLGKIENLLNKEELNPDVSAYLKSLQSELSGANLQTQSGALKTIGYSSILIKPETKQKLLMNLENHEKVPGKENVFYYPFSENIPAYHIRKGEQLYIFINARYKKSKTALIDEIIFHEQAEDQLFQSIEKTHPQLIRFGKERVCHILASCAQVLSYKGKGITGFHMEELRFKKQHALCDLLSENVDGRREIRNAIVCEYYRNQPQIISRLNQYDRFFVGKIIFNLETNFKLTQKNFEFLTMVKNYFTLPDVFSPFSFRPVTHIDTSVLKVSKDGKKHIFLGAYMTGDSWALLFALMKFNDIVIDIFYDANDPQEEKQAKQMLDYYKLGFEESGMGGKFSGRVNIKPLTSTEYLGESVTRNIYRGFNSDEGALDPVKLKRCGFKDDIILNKASAGTLLVADYFNRGGQLQSEFRQTFFEKMIPQEDRQEIEKYCQALNLENSVLLWTRYRGEGASVQEHQGNTNLPAFLQILNMVKSQMKRNAVFIGDNMPGLEKLDPQDKLLVKFWDAPAFTKKPRWYQWYLLYLLSQQGNVIVGNRSGALECPALLGCPVIYLEHREIQSHRRMAQWIGRVFGFLRLRTSNDLGGDYKLHQKLLEAENEYKKAKKTYDQYYEQQKEYVDGELKTKKEYEIMLGELVNAKKITEGSPEYNEFKRDKIIFYDGFKQKFLSKKTKATQILKKFKTDLDEKELQFTKIREVMQVEILQNKLLPHDLQYLENMLSSFIDVQTESESSSSFTVVDKTDLVSQTVKIDGSKKQDMDKASSSQQQTMQMLTLEQWNGSEVLFLKENFKNDQALRDRICLYLQMLIDRDQRIPEFQKQEVLSFEIKRFVTTAPVSQYFEIANSLLVQLNFMIQNVGFIGANDGTAKIVQEGNKHYLEITEKDIPAYKTEILGEAKDSQQKLDSMKHKVKERLNTQKVKEFLQKFSNTELEVEQKIKQAQENLDKLFIFSKVRNSSGKYVLSCGVENRIGFDEEFFRKILEHPELLEIVLFHEALESITPGDTHALIRELQAEVFTENLDLTHFIHAFNLSRQLTDSVKMKKENGELMEKIYHFFQNPKQDDLDEIFTAVNKDKLDVGLLDRIIKGAQKAGLNPYPSLINLLYKEMASGNSDSNARVRIVLSKCGLMDFEIENIVKSLPKIFEEDSEAIIGISSVGEYFLAMLGRRILNSPDISREDRREIAQKLATAFCHAFLPNEKNQKSIESAFVNAFLDSEPLEVSKDSIALEIGEALNILECQKNIFEKYVYSLDAEKTEIEINENVFVRLVKGSMAKLVLKTKAGEKVYTETEFVQKTGMNFQQMFALKAAMDSYPELSAIGTNIRKEISRSNEGESLKKTDRKSLLVVHNDMKQDEIRHVIAFLKQVTEKGCTANHKITGDVMYFIKQAEELGLTDKELTAEYIRKNLVLEQEINDFQGGKPLIVVGQMNLDKYRDLKKTILLNGKKSMAVSMVGVFAFLSKNIKPLEELQKSLKHEDSELKKLSDNVSDEMINRITKTIEIIVPEIKPVLESILSQLADEEETILIAG